MELEILTQLLAGGAEVTVALSCDSPAGGAQIFDAARDTIRSLQRAARQAGAAVQLREFPAEGSGLPGASGRLPSVRAGYRDGVPRCGG